MHCVDFMIFFYEVATKHNFFLALALCSAGNAERCIAVDALDELVSGFDMYT